MKAWILSDIHLELSRLWTMPKPEERPDFDVLVVAGDLIPRMERGVRWLRETVPNRPIIYVPGNHEFYGTDLDRTVEKARGLAAGTNVHVLCDDAVVLGGVRFLGGTLWTDFNLFSNPEAAMAAADDIMNDYRKIRWQRYTRRLKPDVARARHRQTRLFLERQLESDFDGPTVVVTHHAPYPGGISAQHRHQLTSAAYASDLTELIVRTGPTLWIYGHTHLSDDTYLGRTQMISNAKGYGPWFPRETLDNPTFNPLKVVEISG